MIKNPRILESDYLVDKELGLHLVSRISETQLARAYSFISRTKAGLEIYEDQLGGIVAGVRSERGLSVIVQISSGATLVTRTATPIKSDD